MKVAIVALTRGYPEDRSLYKSLIKRNNSIYEHINKVREVPADILLFHEGNISLSDQDYINNQFNGEIKFVNVSRYFTNPILELDEEDKFNLGYRQMCRFNMYHIWDELSDYDYILRVDEDIMISKFDPYVFEYMQSSGIKYMTGRFTKEIHRATNKTLPKYLIENTDLNVKKIYNHKNLKNRFATDYNFRTESDCEVILALYEKKGINFLNDLNGIFAFALYDSSNDKYLIARDHMGIIPLYMGWDKDDIFYISS